MTRISSINDHLTRALPPGSLRRRLASGVFWSLIGAVAVQLAGAITSIIVARILGKDVFGDFGMVRNTITMLGVFAGMGLGMTANKSVAEFRENDPKRAGRILTMCLVLGGLVSLAMTIAVFFSAAWLADTYLHAPQLCPLIQICAPLLLFNSINSIQAAGIGGLESFRHLSVCNAINAVLLAITTSVGAAWGGINGAVWGSLVGVAVACVVLEVAAELLRRSHGVPLVFHGIWQESSAIIHFAFPSFLSSILYQPTLWVVMALLYSRPNGRGEIAIFNAASQWRNLVLFVPGALGQVVLPTLTNLWSSGSNRGYVRTLQAHAAASLIIGFIAALPIIAASPWILSTYGPGFAEGWLAMSFLAASAVMQATCNVIGQSLASLGRMWWGFILNLLWAVELYVVSRTLVEHGATGLAAAFFVVYVLHTVQVGTFTYYDLKRRIPAGQTINSESNIELTAAETMTNEGLS